MRGAASTVAPYRAVLREADLAAADAALFPGILEAARLGYDGKGQARVAGRAQAAAAFREFDAVPCVLEKRLDLALELSVVVARGFGGERVAYPVAENEHRGGILAVSTVPARIDAATRAARDRRHAADRRPRSTTSACCASSSSCWPTGGWWSTRWRRARTTRATTRSTPA